VSTWEPDEARGWYFDVDDLASIMRADTRLVVINFPHNPTGYVPLWEDFNAIIDIVRDRGAFLFSDEMYRFLEIEQGMTLPAACELSERACSLFGLSKTFGLPGLRIGWLATQDGRLLNRISKLKAYTTICSSAPSEILAIIALRSKTKLIQQQLDRVRRNIGVLDGFFMEYQDIFSWNRPTGGSVCFPRMPAIENTYDFCEKLVEEAGIMLAPSRAFQYGDHHIRFGYGRENLPYVIERFAGYLDQKYRA
jgi:aspartate/methionine/tyrosine aminotransferase